MNKRGRGAAIFKKKNKRGSHVGMILSFAIFITFIVFLYAVLKPSVNTGEDKKSTLDYLKMKITENISSNFTSAGVQINSSANPGQKCVTLQNFLAFLEILPPYRIIVKNETENIQPAYIVDLSSGNLEINRATRNNLFFKIYSAPEFDGLVVNTSISCSNPITNYVVSSVKIDNYIFEKGVYSFVNYYNNDYDKLKNDLNVPSGNEFGFEFTQGNGTKISAENLVAAGTVYAEEIPIQYIDNSANIQSGFINIKVW
jgi:flagellar capping protein FliD